MSRHSKVGSHKTSVNWVDNNTLTVQYHNTVVCRIDFNACEVTLNTGGWYSATTKLRMNQAMNQYLGSRALHVYQENYQWYVWNRNTDKTIEFSDNMKVSF